MIVAMYWSTWDLVLLFSMLAAVAIVAIAVGLAVGALVLQGACSLFNAIVSGPHGTNPMRVPRYGKAVGTLAVALACGSLVACPALFLFRLSVSLACLLACVLGLSAMSVVAARMLGVPLGKAALVMVVTVVVTITVIGIPTALLTGQSLF